MGDPTVNAPEPTAADLVGQLRERGVPVAEIARRLRRDPGMIRKIVRGETSGAAYRAVLADWVTTGEPHAVPPRRTNAAGDLVPVRGKNNDDGTRTTVTPEDHAGNYEPVPKQSRYTKREYTWDDGQRRTQITLPRGSKAKGRAIANDAITDTVRATARRQAHADQRASIVLTFEPAAGETEGRTMELGGKGGYDISRLLKAINESDDDVIDHLRTQVNDDRYTNFNPNDFRITGVTIHTRPVPKK
jgi:hypothetical protein